MNVLASLVAVFGVIVAMQDWSSPWSSGLWVAFAGWSLLVGWTSLYALASVRPLREVPGERAWTRLAWTLVLLPILSPFVLLSILGLTTGTTELSTTPQEKSAFPVVFLVVSVGWPPLLGAALAGTVIHAARSRAAAVAHATVGALVVAYPLWLTWAWQEFNMETSGGVLTWLVLGLMMPVFLRVWNWTDAAQPDPVLYVPAAGTSPSGDVVARVR